MIEFGAHACTDVTGFGLMGHLAAMAAASKVDVEIIWDDLPLLPGVLQCLAEGIASGAVERNRESSGHCLTADENVQPAMLDLCFDPQTSGGLLIAVGQDAANDLLERLHAAGIPEAVIIGKVLDTGSGRVFVRTNGRRQLPASRPLVRKSAAIAARNTPIEEQPIKQETSNMSCCEGNHGSDHSAVSEYRRRGGNSAEISRVPASRRRARRTRREDQAGHSHCAVGLGQMRTVREKPCQKSQGNGSFAGRNRRGRLAGHRLRRIADDGVLQ